MSRGKIALIYPPGDLYQRGEDRSQGNIKNSTATSMRACNDLGYAAAVLRDKYDIFLKDFQTEKISVGLSIRMLAKENIDYLCISVTNATIFSDIEYVKEIKKVIPDVAVILKGAIFYDADFEMLDQLDLESVDFLSGGEIEFSIREILEHYSSDGIYDKISNIFYKSSEGKWIKTRFHIWENDLDKVPFPARDLMNNALYIRPDTGEPMATIQTGRGCPSNCIYCLSPTISGRKVRKRSPLNVLEELKECYHKYHIKNFFFKADTFTIDHKWTIELCDLIINSELNGKIYFTANSRSKPISREVLRKMKEAGCFAVAFGFESGSDIILKKIKKGATVKDNFFAMKAAKEAGLQVYGFFLIGFPWESMENIEETRKHIFALNPDFIEIHIALPYYGTELYQECKEQGVLEENILGNDYFHASTKGTRTVGIDELLKFRKKTIRDYYLRPSYILKKFIYAVRKPVILKNYIIYGMRLIREVADIKH